MNDYPKIFDKQPEITPELLKDFETRGLLVPAKTTHKSDRRVAQVTNPTGGEVVGYSLLAKKLRDGEVSPDDARALLVIEATREKGPRDTHIPRLITRAFTADKEHALEQVDSWAKNQN